MKEILKRDDLIIDEIDKENFCQNCQHLKDEMMSKIKLQDEVYDELQRVSKQVVSFLLIKRIMFTHT